VREMGQRGFSREGTRANRMKKIQDSGETKKVPNQKGAMRRLRQERKRSRKVVINVGYKHAK